MSQSNLLGDTPVRILVTGGTIDKVHDPKAENIAFPKDGSSRVPEILETSRCHFPVVESVLMKDSLDFDDTDREAITTAVQNAPEKALVITHGTGTMGETARWLAARVSGKTIVLTGAIRPYSLSFSDGGFNIGSALVAAQLLPPGIYGAMNGRIFPADHLDKNTQTGRFDL